MVDVTYFQGGANGRYEVKERRPIKGQSLPDFSHLSIGGSPSPEVSWRIEGVNSSLRYTTSSERAQLNTIQPSLGRKDFSHAALIVLKKNQAWWDLAQDQRRNIFEEESRHISGLMPQLPWIARKLYHCRELRQEFDFVTWFEFDPDFVDQFDTALKFLRQSREWDYVEAEFELRLQRIP